MPDALSPPVVITVVVMVVTAVLLLFTRGKTKHEDAADVVSLLLPEGRVSHAPASVSGAVEIEVEGAATLRTVHVRHRPPVTVAWTCDSQLPMPDGRTFSLQSFDHNLDAESEWDAAAEQAFAVQSITLALAPKGFEHKADEFDLAIRMFASIRDRISVDELGDAFAGPDNTEWKRALGTALQHNTHRPAVIAKGSLVLDVVDVATGNVLWRAAAVADVASDDAPAARRQRTEQAISQMLEHFPPA